MKTLYLECNMGAAGDMLMAALTELMPDKDAFVKELNDLQIPQVNIERTTIAKCGRRKKYRCSNARTYTQSCS